MNNVSKIPKIIMPYWHTQLSVISRYETQALVKNVIHNIAPIAATIFAAFFLLMLNLSFTADATHSNIENDESIASVHNMK